MILVNFELDSWELRAFQNSWSMNAQGSLDEGHTN